MAEPVRLEDQPIGEIMGTYLALQSHLRARLEPFSPVVAMGLIWRATDEGVEIEECSTVYEVQDTEKLAAKRVAQAMNGMKAKPEAKPEVKPAPGCPHCKTTDGVSQTGKYTYQCSRCSCRWSLTSPADAPNLAEVPA